MGREDKPQPHPAGISDPVLQSAEREPRGELLAGLWLRQAGGQIAGRTGRREQQHRGWRRIGQPPVRQFVAQRIDIREVIGMQVGNDNRVEVKRRPEPVQAADHSRAAIQQDAYTVRLDQVAGAVTSGRRVGGPLAQDGKFHQM